MTEKLDRSNYASWLYKMHQYLLGHGYWSYVDRANVATPDATHTYPMTWEQVTSRVMCRFTSSVIDQLLSHIRDVKMPKEAWTNLRKVFHCQHHGQKASTQAGVDQCPTEGHVVADFTARIKEICDSLASMNATIEEDEMV